MKPSDRPSINNVLKMLEGEVGCLEMPPKPSLSSLERPIIDYMEEIRIKLAHQCNQMNQVNPSICLMQIN